MVNLVTLPQLAAVESYLLVCKAGMKVPCAPVVHVSNTCQDISSGCSLPSTGVSCKAVWLGSCVKMYTKLLLL